LPIEQPPSSRASVYQDRAVENDARSLPQTGSSYQRILDEERHQIARYVWEIRFRS